MRFRLVPLEQRNGEWRVNYLSLFMWVTVFNLLIMAVIAMWPAGPPAPLRPVPARAMKHAVAVIGQGVPLLEAADDAAKQLKTLRQGDTVDLYVAQPAGWYFVTLPDARSANHAWKSYNGGVAGYVREQFLQVPDSMLRNIRQQR